MCCRVVSWWYDWHSAQFLEDDGDRNGLNGGNAENGGPSNVDNNWRDNANDNLAVRLVLARNASIKHDYMAEPRKPPIIEKQKDAKERSAAADTARDVFLSRRLQSEADIEAQREWQGKGSVAQRHGQAAFDGLGYRSVGLPETDALLSALTRAAQDSGYVPADKWHKKVVERLRAYPTQDGKINVLNVLASPETAASVRTAFWEKEIAGLIEYAERKDLEKLREVEEKKVESSPPPLELPPPKQDEMRTSMDEMEKGKEWERPSGYFSVHPFFGGYYREDVFEEHAGGSRWTQQSRQYESAPEVGAFTEERVLRGVVRGGEITPLPVAYGFTPNHASFRAPEGVSLVRDKEGLYAIDARGATSVVEFTVLVGKAKEGSGEEKKLVEGVIAVRETFAGKEARVMLKGLSGTTIEKARAIKRFVREFLTYSNESALNAVYESDSNGYFAGIEKHKKADCDVANAYYLNLLSLAGIKARMAVGHYVKMKDANGAAVMHSGSRHAWSEVWDETARTWMRMDATPPGDPTLDEERPDEKFEDDSGPGDYGEQEAPQITEEELAKFKEKIEEAKWKAKEDAASPEERAAKEFAEQAGCTVEQAREIRKKIEEARRLRDARGRVIRDALAEEFQRIVETNFKDLPEYRGPVTRSQGDEKEDKKMIGKEVRTGHADPLGYAREVIERRLTQEYGGMDILFVFDRSGSMMEVDPAVNRPKKDEQQLAGFLTLDSVSAFSYKTEAAARQDLLVSPLSVRSSVVAFQGGNADVLKPLDSRWGPKEQHAVWSGLESNIGGGTPAHLGLMKVRIEIERIMEEEKKKPGQVGKKRLRLVMVFMDGGVDDETAYLREQKKLEALGVYVSSWGMTESAHTVEAYPEGHCVPSVREMIDPVTKHIVEKAQVLKLKQ